MFQLLMATLQQRGLTPLPNPALVLSYDKGIWQVLEWADG